MSYLPGKMLNNGAYLTIVVACKFSTDNVLPFSRKCFLYIVCWF